MKLIIFLAIFVAGMYLIPDNFVSSLVQNHMHINGDGEEAMDNADFTAIMIKAALSAIVAIALLWFYRLIKTR
ncbi:hypothetical protein PMPD1_2941 [Paramixta manurensis]|uniref:Uncharacterized protein n=1 Tax=Paramixta manurensis TaxID=2740817 RepID=A0A6M8UHJ9_9GAMM|nr:hypothetical protein PMPD1_2941 [Erwiniaceae bacterium PD-1]